ncbi:hypothetical protein FRC06_011899 [Ceratobasidium sp. 370]|nr:hypothetical protein FRC06_011899 [Ceratobasidium sp. 370]
MPATRPSHTSQSQRSDEDKRPQVMEVGALKKMGRSYLFPSEKQNEEDKKNSGAVAEGAVTIAEQGKEIDHLRGQFCELTKRLDELTKNFGKFCQAQATRWTQAEITAHAAAPAVPAAPATPAVPVGPPNTLALHRC